jgi:hypothetical protein
MVSVSEEGVRSVNPQLEFRENGMAYPTKDTPIANREILNHKLITSDLLGQKRTDDRTLGAIQYPVADRKTWYLTEEMVGPNAK